MQDCEPVCPQPHLAAIRLSIRHALAAKPQSQGVGPKEHKVGGAQREARQNALPLAHLLETSAGGAVHRVGLGQAGLANGDVSNCSERLASGS